MCTCEKNAQQYKYMKEREGVEIRRERTSARGKWETHTAQKSM